MAGSLLSSAMIVDPVLGEPFLKLIIAPTLPELNRSSQRRDHAFGFSRE